MREKAQSLANTVERRLSSGSVDSVELTCLTNQEAEEVKRRLEERNKEKWQGNYPEYIIEKRAVIRGTSKYPTRATYDLIIKLGP